MKEKSYNEISEGFLDRMRSFFSSGDNTPSSDADNDLDDDDTGAPSSPSAGTVNIPFGPDGKYPKSGDEAIEDPEVIKLMNFFKKELPNINFDEIKKMTKLDPTRGIKFMLTQAGIDNAGDASSSSEKTAPLSKEVPLSLTKRQKSTQPGEGKPAEVPLNSFMQKKLGLPPRAVNMIVKNIAQTLKSRGVEIAESKINNIIKQTLLERSVYTKDDFDKVRTQIVNIQKRIESENNPMARRALEGDLERQKDVLSRMEADLTGQKTRRKDAKEKKRKDYSDRKKALEKQGAKYGAAGKIIYKYAARQAQKDPEFMKAFGDNPQQQNKIVRSIEKVLRRMLRRRGYTDQEVKAVLKESLSINNLAEMDADDLVSEINKFYPYAKEYLGFDRPVELTLISDPDNAKDTFGKTAYYSPATEQMAIFVDGRHPKDIIRSFSHELVHHAQNCRGEFDREFNVGENYIETDDHLREMEREAYDKGNMCLRTYESYLKKENKTMNEETLRKAIREAIKRVTENKTEIDEAAWKDLGDKVSGKEKKKKREKYQDIGEEQEVTETTDETAMSEDNVEEGSYAKYTRDDDEKMEEETTTEETETVTEEEEVEEAHCPANRDDELKEETLEEDELDEEKTTPLHESMAVKKGELIFDRLVKKWCK